MSIDSIVSNSELSKHAEEYINHAIRGLPYDPSLSGCVVQILSGNPLRISDTTNFLDVNDPSVINTKLKEANKNINWHTMRGAIICLRKWGFTSSYDAANDKLKFDIVIQDVDCIQSSPPSNPIVPDSTSLLEAPFLKNKLNRLKKYHMAEEVNAIHPIETALELIDRERNSVSEMRRLADISHLRGKDIGASLDSDKGPSFWEYHFNQEKPIAEFPATEPIFEDQSREIEAISYKRHIQSLPDNPDLFPISEKYEPQANPFQASLQEDIYDYLAELNDDVLGEKKPQTRNQMEIEEHYEEEKAAKEPSLKRKFHEVLIQKKDSLGGSKPGIKKVLTSSALNSTLEQQKLMKTREDKKFDSDFDTLNLLNASLPQTLSPKAQPQVQSKPIMEKTRIAEPKKSTRTYKTMGKEIEQRPEIHEVQLPHKKPSPAVYFDEEFEYEMTENTGREKSKEKKRSPKKLRDIRKFIPPKDTKETREIKGREKEELLEISNNEYMKSFKMVKFSPLSKEEKESRLASYYPREYEPERRSVNLRNDLFDYEEIAFSRPSKPKSGKTTPSKALYVEDPFDQRFTIDLSDFQMVEFKPATTSMSIYNRK